MPVSDRDLRRLACLDAMGIALYSSRRDLPGAAPSRRVALPDAAAAVAPSPVAESPPGPRRRLAPDFVADSGTRRRAPEPPPPAPAEPAGVSAARFTLAAIVCGGALWVEELGALPLAREQVALVRSMAVACRWQPPEPAVQQFAWPLHNNPQLDSGPEAAAAALQAFLRRVAEDANCARVVLLGDAAAERVDVRALNVETLTLPSTRDMLAEPGRKRAAWEVLKPLRAS